ncbi:MAG: HD-GYP domain-containing protein [Planctomycetota bacterium]|jgi:putative two-component system response regulator
MEILIVDDDEFSLSVLQDVLDRAGYEVRAARNGREGLEVLRTTDCRLVISDWMMPEMDGIQLCREVRSADLPGYVYFILLTGRDETEDVVEALSAGADDFLTKPFKPAELRVRVRAGERILALETRDVAIFAMAKLAESRDPETGAHLERIRHYSRLLAEQLSAQDKFARQADGGFVRLIFLTSPLHDIGKVGIPDSVLLKPGRLNDREFEIMKSHASIGAQTLAAAVRQYPSVLFLTMARDIALTHHERFDGGGYPRGLAGEAIPLAGRIVALADVYDALTSKRVYKEAFAHEVARGIILEERGKHFDADVVDAFVAAEAEFVAIRERFDELPLRAAA